MVAGCALETDPVGFDSSSSESTGDTTTGGDSDETLDEDTGGFIPETDTDDCSGPRCEPFAQDCPEDAKCTPRILDGCGVIWTCSLVVPELPKDAPCVSEIGADACDADSFCYPAFGEPGTCTPFPGGSSDNPWCDDPERGFAFDELHGYMAGCRPVCDPLTDAPCPEMQGCETNGAGQFICLANTGGLEDAACTVDQDCVDGPCVPATEHPACEGDACCSRWCDLQAPDCPMASACLPLPGSDPDATVGSCRAG